MVLSREKLGDPPPNLHIGICMVSFFKKINLKIFILGGAVVGLAVNVAFLSCGLLSSSSAWASHCSDFSGFGAQALELMGFNSCSTEAQ